MGSLRLGLAQINTTVGDLEGNLELISAWTAQARTQNVDILVFPELTITGYPPEDLLLHPQFIEDNLKALDRVAPMTEGISAIVGYAGTDGDKIYNASAIFSNGILVGSYRKALLPNYEVFDEKRYFIPGEDFPLFIINDVRVGVTICEDLWEDGPPVEILAEVAKAQIVLNLSASPFHTGKVHEREQMMAERAKKFGIHIAFCNLVGGQDELIFAGRSAVFSPERKVIARAPGFKDDLLVVDLDFDQPQVVPKYENERAVPPTRNRVERDPIEHQIEALQDPTEAIYSALVLGTQDYVQKNGMQKALIGISGGIDSALVAAIACDALGAENVMGVYMPSQFSSEQSARCAAELARNLGFHLEEITIDSMLSCSLDALALLFKNSAPDITEENLQSRIRGMVLMALSNKWGMLVLTTGNKSEYAVGYATLYGDMVGGLAVIKDVTKRRVYELANWRNTQSTVIPQEIIDRPPSAELRADQIDEDDLPLSYEILDQVIEHYVEEDVSVEEIEQIVGDPEAVREVIARIDANEFKRRQSAPGLRVTQRAFGKDRRFPITNRYYKQEQGEGNG